MKEKDPDSETKKGRCFYTEKKKKKKSQKPKWGLGIWEYVEGFDEKETNFRVVIIKEGFIREKSRSKFLALTRWGGYDNCNSQGRLAGLVNY